MNDTLWTFEALSRDCDGHYCMADGNDYPALCRYEENMTSHPLGDACGADCMGECSERVCPSEGVRRLIGKPKPMQHLRNRRHALRLTLEGLARRAGLSKGFLSLVENGKVGLGLDTAVRLAKALQVDLEELSGMLSSDASRGEQQHHGRRSGSAWIEQLDLKPQRSKHMSSENQELPGMMALAKGVQEGTWPHTMDAQVWARKWLEITKDKPGVATDEGAMIGWFANAIMAGYDSAIAMLRSNTSREAR